MSMAPGTGFAEPQRGALASDAADLYLDREFNRLAAKIGPGGYYVSGRDLAVVTVLGSCVSACIYDPVARIGGMNHFMLPECGGDPGRQLSPSARYGAYAMEVLINRLLGLGAERYRLLAKVFGGARVLQGVTDIGRRNAAFALAYLRRERIAVVASDLGGVLPRKLYFFTQTGRVLLKELRSADQETVIAREDRHARRLGVSRMGGEVDLF
ncbi:chemoreceptor glutamine deamidase CheD [Aromatoleum toluclasticum]|uniref:chemoreceptor glutamine deamidase CheD n=1 Tax=Aromatoleum toluclasticum TaxID=92003 RepID=UPI000377846A|nr:chemoreceptor glutamine deamidase CheD [Aromatoleum toluclasticum]